MPFVAMKMGRRMKGMLIFGDRILASSDHECKGLITARLVKKRVLHFD
jgi:hypothetical protein